MLAAATQGVHASLSRAATRGLPRVCVSTLTRATRGSVAESMCVCTRAHHGSAHCVPRACTPCGFSRGRQVQAVGGGFREEAQRVKVFAFWEGPGGGTLPLPPPGEDYCSGNSWGKLGKPGQLIRPSAALWVQNCIPSENSQSSTVTLGVWSVVCLAFAPGGCWLTASSGGPPPPLRGRRRSHWAWRIDLVSSVPGVLPYMGPRGRLGGFSGAASTLQKRAKRGMCCSAHGCREEDTLPTGFISSVNIPRLQLL